MNDFFENLSDVMIHGREWSWSVIGILYVLITLLIRSWFLKPVIKIAKDLKRSHYTEVKDQYLKHALSGWLFYLASLGIVLFIWSRPTLFPLTVGQALALLVALLFYIFTLLLHLQALGIAGYRVLKNAESARD